MMCSGGKSDARPRQRDPPEARARASGGSRCRGRASDLPPEHIMRSFGGLAALTVIGALSAAIYAGALPAAAWLRVDLLAAHPVVVAVLFVLYLADRKSTRLNSSHVEISYAV